MTELEATGALTDARVIADLADEAASRTVVPIDNDLAVLVLRADQKVEPFDLARYRPNPNRKTGTVVVTDAASLIEYVNRHAVPAATTVWSDIEHATVTAVFDDHERHDSEGKRGYLAGWGQHRATLKLRETPDWTHWVKIDGQLVTQQRFAEHIEDGVDAIRDPDAATMLEIAQTFHAKHGANFKSTVRLSGEIQFAFDEQTSAKAGTSGRLEVPEIVTLGLAPFEGSPLFEVKARLRFRLSDGNLTIGYRLIRPDKARRAAFEDVVGQVTLGVDLPVMAGSPRPAA